MFNLLTTRKDIQVTFGVQVVYSVLLQFQMWKDTRIHKNKCLEHKFWQQIEVYFPALQREKICSHGYRF